MADEDYRGKLLRLFRTIMLLTRSPFGLSIQELSEKLGINSRTVYRDMKLMEAIGFSPEEVSRGKYVLRGIDSDTRKFEKNLQFNAEEAGILARAVMAIPDSNPMKNSLTEKLLSFSGMEDVLGVLIKQNISRNIEMLAKAAREKKQVILVNYQSPHSQSIKSRKVEPYAFSTDGVYVKAFEVEAETNKTYKIERIELVEIQTQPWKFERKHLKEKDQDIFGIEGEESHTIRLKLSMRAARLLQEEFPLTAKFIFKEDRTSYVFEGEASSFLAVGRFVLGLLDEIEVMKPTAFKNYLEKRVEGRNFGLK